MGHIGVPEIALIVLAVIILFGAKKLPEIGSALGKAIREFKKAGKGVDATFMIQCIVPATNNVPLIT